MIVQCISFGSHWWLREVYDRHTGALLRHRSAFMNTTGFNNHGAEYKFKHWLPGFVRINAGTWPRFNSPKELLQAKFHTDGITRFKETNRLMLRLRAPDDAEVDRYLVCISSQTEGMINFNSHWKCDGPARIFSSSYFAKVQETLLLLEYGTTVQTSLGSWRIMCKAKTSFLGLVDGR